MKIHGAVRASRLRAVDAVRPAVVTHEGWSSSSSSSEPIARRLSWAALEELSDVVARLLRDDLLVGLRGKPRVALLAGNSGEWLAAALGVSKTGAVLVPLNTRWSPPEVAEVLGDSGATVVLMDGPGQSLLAEALQSVAAPEGAEGSRCSSSSSSSSSSAVPDVRWSVLLPPYHSEAPGGGVAHPWQPQASPLLSSSASTTCPGRMTQGGEGGGGDESPPEETYTFMYTSGTTGRPKGAMHSHAAHMVQAAAKTASAAEGGDEINEGPRYDSGTVLLCPAPLYHVGGLSSTLAVLAAGGTVVFPGPSSGSNHAKAATATTTQKAPGNQSPPASSRGNDDNGNNEEVVTPRHLGHAIVAHGVNTLVVVPTMLRSLLLACGAPVPEDGQISGGVVGEAHRSSNPFLGAVRSVLVGGQSPSRALLSAAAAAAHPSARFVQTYACTEACSSVTFLDLGRYFQMNKGRAGGGGSVAARGGDSKQEGSQSGSSSSSSSSSSSTLGSPIGFSAAAHVEVALLPCDDDDDDDDKRDYDQTRQQQQQQQQLELATRGPHVMLGYWKRPEATAAAIDGEGWLRTGDLGRPAAADDTAAAAHRRFRRHRRRGLNPNSMSSKAPFLWFVGRRKDMIKSGGENVFAAEVEAAVLSLGLPSVAAVAVFGVPDAQWGERVVAAVVLKQQPLGKSSHSNDNDNDGPAPSLFLMPLPSVEDLPLRGPTTTSNWVLPGKLLIGTAPGSQTFVTSSSSECPSASSASSSKSPPSSFRDSSALSSSSSSSSSSSLSEVAESCAGEVARQLVEEGGVTTFVCLQEGPGEAGWTRDAYRAALVNGEGEKRLEFIHFPIPDMTVPTPAALEAFVRRLARRLIDDDQISSTATNDAKQQQRPPDVLYVHCHQGHGRTGTVAVPLVTAVTGADGEEAARFVLAATKATRQDNNPVVTAPAKPSSSLPPAALPPAALSPASVSSASPPLASPPPPKSPAAGGGVPSFTMPETEAQRAVALAVSRAILRNPLPLPSRPLAAPLAENGSEEGPPLLGLLPREATTALAAAIRAGCAGRLAAFKVPKEVVGVTALPTTATGKVQKHRLAELVLQRQRNEGFPEGAASASAVLRARL